MKIVDITTEYEELYFQCLEDWSDEMKESGNKKRIWYSKIKEKGLRVKFALDNKDVVGGMIQYLPIEHSNVDGKNLYFIPCIWVHGYKQGRGNFQKQGMGQALLKAAEDDVKKMDAKGIVAWGISLPFWMKASWYKKQGYKKVDKNGMSVLMWKPFVEDAVPPKWIRERKRPTGVPGKVTVTAFINGGCPAQNIVYERAKKAATEIGDKVIFNEIDTFDKDNLLEWGISDALFIDDKQVRTGPPPSYEKIKKLIQKRAKKLK